MNPKITKYWNVKNDWAYKFIGHKSWACSVCIDQKKKIDYVFQIQEKNKCNILMMS